MAAQLMSYLPSAEGLLPKWLLFISVVSIANSAQAYISLKGTQEVYAGSAATGIAKDKPTSSSPVTPLSARTFGTWTAISSVVRLYAAYHINDPTIYEMCMWTFGIAFAHFMSEWLVFGTARWSRGLAGPVFVATGTLTWMVLQKEAYVA